MEIINRKAKFDYFTYETYEAGIVLTGTEIKSIRNGKANIKDSYAIIRNNEIFLINTHISLYDEGNRFNHVETRTRKLLLHKKEIYKLRSQTIERVFADAKEKHGMRYTQYRGLEKVRMELNLLFACMNLKKLANWIWKDTFGLVRRTPISKDFYIFYLYIIKMVPFTLAIGTICLQTETIL